MRAQPEYMAAGHISATSRFAPASCRSPPSLKRWRPKGDARDDRTGVHDRDTGARQSARRAVAEPEADAPRAGLRLPRLDPRRCDRAEAGISGRHHRRPDPFQPVRAVVRADLGPGLVRDRMPVRALSQSRLRGRGSSGQHRKAEAGPNHLRDRHDQARRHRDFARHRFGRRRWFGDRASPAARRTEAARRSRHSRRSQGRHEDRPPDRENGFRPEHGRPLSVFAGRKAEGDHRTFGRIIRRNSIPGAGRSSPWRC